MVLPLTLAIIDGMLVACGAEKYIIPSLAIVESLRPTADMVSRRSPEGARSSTSAARSCRCSASTGCWRCRAPSGPLTESPRGGGRGAGAQGRAGAWTTSLSQQQVVIKPLGARAWATPSTSPARPSSPTAAWGSSSTSTGWRRSRPAAAACARRGRARGRSMEQPTVPAPSSRSPTSRRGSTCAQGKAALVQARLAKRLRELGLTSERGVPRPAPRRRRPGRDRPVPGRHLHQLHQVLPRAGPLRHPGEDVEAALCGGAAPVPVLVRRLRLGRGALHRRP